MNSIGEATDTSPQINKSAWAKYGYPGNLWETLSFQAFFVIISGYTARSEQAMAPHSNNLAWKIPWTEEPGRLQFVGSLRVGHDWAASLVAQTVKNLPAVPDTHIRSLDWEDPLEKGVATHSSIVSWRIPWTVEPGELQSVGSQRVGDNWATKTFTYCTLNPHDLFIV